MRDFAPFLVDHSGEVYNEIRVIGFDYENYETQKAKVIMGIAKRIKPKWICECACGKLFSVNLSKIKNGHTKSCGRCRGYICDSHPELVKYFKNKNIPATTFGGSKTKAMIVCPDCGFETEMIISNFTRRRFQCHNCSDGKSYAEKFILNILKLGDFKITPEYSPKWANGKRYDFYIEEANVIIEVHGVQHYQYTGFNRSLEEEQENDTYKERLAKENGILNYIIIDARESLPSYLKDSVLSSGALNVLEMDEKVIDWSEIFIKSDKSLVIEAWNLKKENQSLSTMQAAKILNISVNAIAEYWKKGNDAGECHYNPKESVSKKVECDGTIFESITKCARHYGVNNGTMQSWVNGKCKMPEEFQMLGLKLA